MLWFFYIQNYIFLSKQNTWVAFQKEKKWSKCFKFKLTESTSRSSKSWEKSIPRFGLGIVDQFEWWLVFVMEIRVLIVCLRSKLRLVLIDIFSVRICCTGPVRNLDFYERLRIKHFSGGLPFPNDLILKKVDMACPWIFLGVDMVPSQLDYPGLQVKWIRP